VLEKILKYMTYKKGNMMNARKQQDREMDWMTMVYALLLLGAGLVVMSELVFYVAW